MTRSVLAAANERASVTKAHPAVLLCLLLCDTPALSCESDAAAKVVSKQSIAMQSAMRGAALYYRAGRHAIFVDRQGFTTTVERAFKRYGHGADERLLRELRNRPSSQHPLDVFALALDDPSLLRRIEFYLGELLGQGKAAVVDVLHFPGDPGRMVPRLNVVTMQNDNWKGRRFCTPGGEVLLEITDSIV